MSLFTLMLHTPKIEKCKISIVVTIHTSTSTKQSKRYQNQSVCNLYYPPFNSSSNTIIYCISSHPPLPPPEFFEPSKTRFSIRPPKIELTQGKINDAIQKTNAPVLLKIFHSRQKTSKRGSSTSSSLKTTEQESDAMRREQYFQRPKPLLRYLPQAVTTITLDLRARHERARIRRQVNRQPIQLIHIPQPSLRSQASPDLLLRIERRHAVERRVHVTRGDGVDTDTVLCPLSSQRATEVHHTRLGGVVARLLLGVVDDRPRHTGDEDDRPRLLSSNHGLRDSLSHEE
jgi:hypothetical protein